MAKREGNISVMMLPWLAHGHLSPFLELAKRLAERGFLISLCSTATNLDSIKKKITGKHSQLINLVELHLPPSPELPPHYHTTNGLPPHLMTTLKIAFEAASPTFEEIMENLKPDLLIYDFNQPWAADLATSRNIPAVEFLTIGAAVNSYSFHAMKNTGEAYPFPEIYPRQQHRMTPESSGIDGKEIYSILQAVDRSCDIIVIRTCREIEEKYIDHLSALLQKKMVPVGSLVHDSINEAQETEYTQIIKWLDKKPKSSTIFVSFGTEFFLSKQQIEELGHGLELSNVNFIWVVRFPLGNKKIEFAEGFLERVGDRGMVVEGWAPQAKILAHPSIGGFVSHCGWGSVMESMKLGVPIIAMPMQLDQPLNARLVEEVGVGVEVLSDENGGFKGEAIGEAIRKVVVEEGGEGVRKKAKELSERLKLEGEDEIGGVVEELVLLCSKWKNI